MVSLLGVVARLSWGGGGGGGGEREGASRSDSSERVLCRGLEVGEGEGEGEGVSLASLEDEGGDIGDSWCVGEGAVFLRLWLCFCWRMEGRLVDTSDPLPLPTPPSDWSEDWE